MARYERLGYQPNRLGSWSGLGQGDPSAYIDAIGRAITGVTDSIGRTQVLKTQAKIGGKVAITQTVEATKQLDISTKGQTQQAAIGVQKVTATYTSLSQLILGAGIAAAGLLLAGGVAFRLATKKK